MTETSKEGFLEHALARLHRFNHAKQQGIGAGEYQLDMIGDIRFNAPEVIMGKPYDFKADCWSFGIILYFMLTNELPFDYERTFFGFKAKEKEKKEEA